MDRLVELLSSRKMGVVAHFYMDPEVRGRDGGESYRSSIYIDPEAGKIPI